MKRSYVAIGCAALACALALSACGAAMDIVAHKMSPGTKFFSKAAPQSRRLIPRVETGEKPLHSYLVYLTQKQSERHTSIICNNHYNHVNIT